MKIGSAVSFLGSIKKPKVLLNLDASFLSGEKALISAESLGIVLDKKFYGSLNWIKVIFPEGVGWVPQVDLQEKKL